MVEESAVFEDPYISRVINKEEEFDCEKWIEHFEETTKNAEIIQKELLRKILRENSETEYLRKYGINGGNNADLETFKAHVRLVEHSDLSPYIDRIVNGDTSTNILTRKPITSLTISSGTSSGKRKYIPYHDEWMDATAQACLTSCAYIYREYPTQEGKKALHLLQISKAETTKEGGLDVSTVVSRIVSSARTKKLGLEIRNCSPYEALCTSDVQQGTYCHLICSLIYRDEIQFISSGFAHSIVLAYQTFEQQWQELCNDIKTGVLSSRIVDPPLRAAISSQLRPDPGLAETIHKICVKGLSDHWHGILPKLYPSAKYVIAILTGSSQNYLGRLKVYAGDLPLVSSNYLSSEGCVGVNIDPKVPPEMTTYVVHPRVQYFEFLPSRGSQQNDEVRPLGLHEVKVGEEYEVVITNFIGLYRYKLGDLVKVVGFHNSTPMLQFICRANVILSINVDKTTEKDLQIAVEAASKFLQDSGIELLDYTSYADLSHGNEHYIIFWELNSDVSDDILRKCCSCLDKEIPEDAYQRRRKAKEIGALELRIVQRGTLNKIIYHVMSSGGNVIQFKMPKSLKKEQFLRIMNDNVIASYLSNAYD